MNNITPIQLSKFSHRGETRIKVQFEKDDSIISKIKSIPNRRWSQTKRCWHLPYSKYSIDQLKTIFGDNALVFPQKDITPPPLPIAKIDTSPHIKKLSSIRIVEYQVADEIRKTVIGEIIIVQQKKSAWLNVFVPGDKKGWVEVIKNIKGRKWKIDEVCWEIPNVKQSYWELKKQIGLNYIQFDFKIKKDIPEEYQFPAYLKRYKKKVKTKAFDLLNENQKNEITKLEEQIILKRLSPTTLKSYRNHLISIFLYHKKIHPAEISTVDIQKYILYQIRKKRISESTQNQIINAYKAYAEKVLKRSREFINIERPKKSRKLPNVLSTNEVVSLINSVNNLKHKLALVLIYSAGLRKSELLNLQRKNIHLDRKTLHIKAGKGKKDRYVTLAETVIPYLKKYLKSYNPTRWLFEGQTGGKYSSTSLQKIFERALESSQINSYATLHTLRHSYATHCVENGHNLKSVQEALGHGSLKTTEIYLHISSEALKKLKSPLDSLEID